MRKNIVKLTAVMTTVSLVTLTGCGANGANVDTSAVVNEVTEAVIDNVDEEKVNEVVNKVKEVAGVESDSNVDKDETVYVSANADGSIKEIIVSDWLKNTSGEAKIDDVSDLDNIENVKGYEEFTQSSDGSIVWNSEGSDIYYQGTSSKELPVDVSITYTLDGKQISAKDLAGKSGNLVMRFDYRNNSKQVIKINDKDEEIFTPFTMVTGMILPEEKVKNVTVSTGKVISDGSKVVVVGMAMPGLKDSLGLEDKNVGLDLNDYVEITADVEDFELTTTATIAMADLMNDIDIDSAESFEDIEEDIETLTDASNQLVDGTGELKDGAQKLKDGSNELKEGASKLDDGIIEADDGVKQIIANYPAAVKGANDLAEGLKTLNKEVKSFGKLGKTLDTTKSDNDKKASEMESTTLPADQASVSSAVTGVITNAVTPAVEAGVATAANAAATAAAAATTETISSYISENVAAQADTIGVIVQQLAAAGIDVDTATTYATAIVTAQVLNTVDASNEAFMASLNANVASAATAAVGNSQSDIAAAAQQAAANVDSSSVTTAVTQLATDYATYGSYLGISGAVSEIRSNLDDETINKLTDGVSQLKDGSVQLADGIEKLSDATGQLSTGLGQIREGSGQLKDGTVTLDNGVGTLKDGVGTLDDGMNTFNDDGIEKLSDVYNNDIKSLKDRVTAIKDAGASYQTYTGLGDNKTGSVKFIITTEGIEK